jgi:hypothetical protein
MHRQTGLTAVLCFVLSVAVPAASLRTVCAQDATTPETGLVVQPGHVQGSVVELDAKTPVTDAKVVLLDKDGKSIGEFTTNDKGVFDLGDRGEGTYGLKIGNASGKLILKKGAAATSLRFVLDPDVAHGRKKGAGAAEKLEGFSTGDGILIVVAVVVLSLAIVGGAIIIAQSRPENRTLIINGNGTAVSPTAP